MLLLRIVCIEIEVKSRNFLVLIEEHGKEFQEKFETGAFLIKNYRPLFIYTSLLGSLSLVVQFCLFSRKHVPDMLFDFPVLLRFWHGG
jgi:hypothetical protein